MSATIETPTIPTPTEIALGRLIRSRICGECPRRSRNQKLRIDTPRICELDCCIYKHLSELAHYTDTIEPTRVSYDGAVQAVILHERNRQREAGHSDSLASLIEHRTEIAEAMRQIATARSYLPTSAGKI